MLPAKEREYGLVSTERWMSLISDAQNSIEGALMFGWRMGRGGIAERAAARRPAILSVRCNTLAKIYRRLA